MLIPRTLPAFFILSMMCPGVTVAQDLDREARLVEQRAAKLRKPFLENASWHLDYDQARAAAKKGGKFLLTYFTRSYAP